jgi:hypothetical protein
MDQTRYLELLPAPVLRALATFRASFADQLVQACVEKFLARERPGHKEYFGISGGLPSAFFASARQRPPIVLGHVI